MAADEILMTHEAGHAVVARAMGFEVTEIVVTGRKGHVARRTTVVRRGQWDDAMVKLAGLAAEFIALGGPPVRLDLDTETREVVDLFGEEEALNLYDDTVALLREKWDDVAQIVADLRRSSITK